MHCVPRKGELGPEKRPYEAPMIRFVLGAMNPLSFSPVTRAAISHCEIRIALRKGVDGSQFAVTEQS